MKYHVGERDDLFDRMSDAYLTINSCGVSRHKTDFCVTREKGRRDYLLLYLVRGTCTALYGGREHILCAGGFVLYPPGTRQRYTFYAREKAESLFLHFTGLAAEEVLQDGGLSPGVRRAMPDGEAERLFRRLILQFALPARAAKCNGLLLLLLSALAEGGETRDCPEGVQRIVRHMARNPHKKTPVSEYAGMLHVSRGELQRLFREATGKSPYQFQLDLRLERAKELLDESDWSIGRVSAEAGFDDPLYFSRFFKKRTGVTPTEYKKRARRQK